MSYLKIDVEEVADMLASLLVQRPEIEAVLMLALLRTEDIKTVNIDLDYKGGYTGAHANGHGDE